MSTRTIIRATSLTVVALAATTAIAAAPTPAKQLFDVHEELVRPSQLAAYEKAAAEFTALVKANQSLMPHFGYYAIQGTDFHFYYVVPMSKMADADAIDSDFGAIMGSPAGSKMMDIMARSSAAAKWTKDWIVELRPDLSYQPAKPALAPQEMKYWRYDWYYIEAGKEMEAEAIAKDFAAAYTARQLTSPYNIYWGGMGTEMPLLIVASPAKDPADLWTRRREIEKALGADGKALWDRAWAVTRKFESREGWSRPDLSTLDLATMAAPKP